MFVQDYKDDKTVVAGRCDIHWQEMTWQGV